VTAIKLTAEITTPGDDDNGRERPAADSRAPRHGGVICADQAWSGYRAAILTKCGVFTTLWVAHTGFMHAQASALLRMYRLTCSQCRG